jgi:NAD(P)-dependent dehydrogenase (short-subunit alcohol dehydrogenase family)
MGILQDKVTIVTGGSSGIGEATAELFAKEGAKVIIAGASDKGQAVAERLGVTFIKTDVALPEEVDDLVDRVTKRFGRLDIMFNNAGVGDLTPIIDHSNEQFDRLVSINLGGVFYGTRAAGHVMKRQGAGVIMNTSSIAGVQPVVGQGVYSAAKAAVLSLTKGSAAELAPFGIRVNAICPGVVPTPMAERMGITAEQYAALPGLTRMGRVGRAEEVAECALYLASDRSSFVTGHYIVIDGGATCASPIKN